MSPMGDQPTPPPRFTPGRSPDQNVTMIKDEVPLGQLGRSTTVLGSQSHSGRSPQRESRLSSPTGPSSATSAGPTMPSKRTPHPAQLSSDNLYQIPYEYRNASHLSIQTGSSQSQSTIMDREAPYRAPPLQNIAIRSPTNPGLESASSMKQPKLTMVRKDRSGYSARQPNLLAPTKPDRCDPWKIFVNTITCCFCTVCLKSKMPNPLVQYAWREKIALCFICLLFCAALGYITFGLQRTICDDDIKIYSYQNVNAYTPAKDPHRVVIHGTLYDMSSFLPTHNALPYFKSNPDQSNLINTKTGKDISSYFPRVEQACVGILSKNYTIACKTADYPGSAYCHNWQASQAQLSKIKLGPVTYSWSDINSTTKLMVYKTFILDMTDFLASQSVFFPPETMALVKQSLGRDSSFTFGGNMYRKSIGDCLADMYMVGRLEDKSVGCFTSDLILYISLIIILSVVLIRFVLAVAFSWFLSRKLGKLQKNAQHSQATRKSILADGKVPFPMYHQGEWNAGTSSISMDSTPPKSSALRQLQASPGKRRPSLDIKSRRKQMADKSQSQYGKELHTIMLVTCYSEGEQGLRTTFDSIALTQYSEDYKLLFIVADGIITGSGNPKSTPDLIIDMLEMDKSWPIPPPSLSYFSLADGSREHNKAQVYAAWYNINGRSVPTILVVKCGTEEEAGSAKPGNRGKRDSQMILMRFLEKVNFNERLCPLEFELFQKIHYLMGVTPDRFEIVLMVDADTKVAVDSLARMVACMAEDPKIMGLCGETRIANKSESWVTRIQVFEYFVSQHLAKAFESIFGNVTCLPGCFCMYRIKAPKGDGYWVPILTNPDVINTYSERVVESLHKKNLLLLGEDRFLTTLMLRTFPRRKLIFVPRAYCKTTVPAEFKVLLSQRRRWINSTIHNLMELVLVRELCGVFCISMQFVIILELVGTVTLPAAIIFTILLIIVSIVGTPQVIPLILLAAILGLPAVLILFTTRRLIYIYWMFIYLLALPIWNFVLPVYAFWHFDDFSWGATRQVHGEGKDRGHGSSGGQMLQSGVIPQKRWADWERERRLGMRRAQ